MPDTQRTLAALLALTPDNTSGDTSNQDLRDMLVSMYPTILAQPQGRLTTESGVAVSTSDRTSQSTLYYTPYNGNGIWLYDGTLWKNYNFTERSLTLSGLTSGKNYDIFIYDNSGTLTLELSTAWTNDTTRADALTTQDGILVKSSATTRRYVGTIRTTGTTTTEDSQAKRFVWNLYSQVDREMVYRDTTDTWTYSSTTIRQAGGNSANKVEFVCGVPSYVQAMCMGTFTNNLAAAGWATGIGVDTTTTMSGIRGAAYGHSSVAYLTLSPWGQWNGTLSAGYHYLAWLEYATVGSAIVYGDGGGLQMQSGITGSIKC